jgi:zinc/manganese transport system substrate-binding protein
MRLRLLVVAGLLASLVRLPPAHADSLKVVAAENFYGDVATQIGGSDVAVSSILSNPDEDPHLFEISPAVGRDVSAARVVIYNGIDYDPWMERILGAVRSTDRQTVAVAQLVGRKTGDNPHIWYDPKTMLALAQKLSQILAAADPGNRTAYEERRLRFEQSLQSVEAKIAALRKRLAGTPVTATEPIFGYMFDALGLQVKNGAFQLAVMNNTEPSASQVAAFETDLKSHAVKLLVYNSQATDPIADRMRNLAQAAGVPVVGATETEPPGKDYQTWMMSELDAIDQALPPLNR